MNLTEGAEPWWALKKDAWGRSQGRYSFSKRGWSCHHCGGLFRGKSSLLSHQELVITEAGRSAREQSQSQEGK